MDNNYTLTLPVPLDGLIYKLHMGCDFICTRQRNKYKRELSKDIPNACGVNTICANNFVGVHTVKLELENLSEVLTNWNKIYFASYQEAEKVGQHLGKTRTKTLAAHGFAVSETYATTQCRQKICEE